MPFKKVFEGFCETDWPENCRKFKEEDGGQALIATISDEAPPNPQGQMFVRIQSWDENCEHREARQIEGKRVRVTIEEI